MQHPTHIKMTARSTIRIHPHGKIDIHHKSDRLSLVLDDISTDDSMHPENRLLLQDFIRDCRLGKTVKGKAKKKIGAATCLKHLFALRLTCCYWGKSLNSVDIADMERFVEALDEGRITSIKRLPYAEETRAGIKKSLRKFWKWKDGDNKAYPEIVDWIDTHSVIKEVPALSKEEILKMIDHTANPRDKALLMVLFDSGARVEELLNVRLKPEHLFFKEQLGCYMIRLEYSKTKPRTISLPLSTKQTRTWLHIHPAEGNPQAQLFPLSYGNLRMLVGRIGKRVLNKRVTPHMLRHSSATFYASKLKNRYKLCYRYGWAMSSDMVDRYLDREGLMEEETVELVKTDEISSVNRQNQRLEEELFLLKESNCELQARLLGVGKESGGFKAGNGFLEVLLNLANQQRQMAEALEQVTGQRFDIVLPSCTAV